MKQPPDRGPLLDEGEQGYPDAADSEASAEICEQLRKVILFEPDKRKTNNIHTHKYTILTFLPLVLFEQLAQLANAYFLLVSFLQLVRSISNTNGAPLTLIPLSIVVAVGAAKEGFEDFKRAKADRRENNRIVNILDKELQSSEIPWKDLRPGMLFRIRSGDRLPADALLVAASGQNGGCSVETMNLDGESNLKRKQASLTPAEWAQFPLPWTSTERRLPEMLLECDVPSVELYHFAGVLTASPICEKRPVSMANMLLRGTSLQQTDWAICLAVYCGHDTREMKNAQSARHKLSQLDVEIGWLIVVLFALQIVGCFTLAVCGVLWANQVGELSWYLPHRAGRSVGVHIVHLAMTWLLQTNSLVPISLLVTLTAIKFVQAWFVSQDEVCRGGYPAEGVVATGSGTSSSGLPGSSLHAGGGCGDAAGGASGSFGQGRDIMGNSSSGQSNLGKRAEVHTSQVIESLGQVTHVFSDKTGTLTQNVMEYKACSIAGRMYGLGALEACPQEVDEMSSLHVHAGSMNAYGNEAAHTAVAGCASGGAVAVLDVPQSSWEQTRAQSSFFEAACGHEARLIREPYVNFDAKDFRDDLAAARAADAAASRDGRRPVAIAEFLLAHALCHTVEAAPGNSTDYHASSPDELALVSAARALGVGFLRNADGVAELEIQESSALTSALEAATGWQSRGQQGRHSGQSQMQSQCHGLLMGVEVLDVCEFDNDRKRMSVVVQYPDGRKVLIVKGADSSVLPFVDRSGSLDCTNVSKCEQHLYHFATLGLRTLCFASTVLDEPTYKAWHERYEQARVDISEGGPGRVAALAVEIETMNMLDLLGATAIEDCLQEGVPETVAQLRQAGVRVWVLTGDKVETALSIAFSCRLLTKSDEIVVLDSADRNEVRQALSQALNCRRPALVVTGVALAIAFSMPHTRTLFVEVAQRCTSVMCCRVSPKQKADVVLLVKANDSTAVTLAIGDGANDVSMIVSAHVGVGLAGKEGAQAAHVSDVAIAEFRILRRLIFAHGRESYRRMATLALYNFYKNQVVVWVTVMVAPASGFSGLNAIPVLFVQLYNILYTHSAVVLYGIFDRAVEDLRELEFRAQGFRQELFTRRSTALWFLASFLQALTQRIAAPRVLRGRSTGAADFSDRQCLGLMYFLWTVLGANVTMVFRHASWHSFMWMPYAFNISTAIFSAWLLQFPMFGGLDAFAELTGADWLRFILATALVIIVQAVAGEICIRSAASEKRVVDADEADGEAAPGATRSRDGSLMVSNFSAGSSFSIGKGYAFSEECALQREDRPPLRNSIAEMVSVSCRRTQGPQRPSGEIELLPLPTRKGPEVATQSV